MSLPRQSRGQGLLFTILTLAFLLFDTAVKVLNLPVAVNGTVGLGHPAGLVMYLGIVGLICLAAYLYPRTAALGAILLFFGKGSDLLICPSLPSLYLLGTLSGSSAYVSQ